MVTGAEPSRVAAAPLATTVRPAVRTATMRDQPPLLVPRSVTTGVPNVSTARVSRGPTGTTRRPPPATRLADRKLVTARVVVVGGSDPYEVVRPSHGSWASSTGFAESIPFG